MAGKKAKDLKDGLDLIAGEKGVIKSAKSAFSAISTVSKPRYLCRNSRIGRRWCKT